MIQTGKLKTGFSVGAVVASLMFSVNAQAYDDGYYGSRGGSGSGSGMGMGMGSGSGYNSGSGYYGGPGYGYQRPPMRPYGYDRPPMPPMRPYGSQRPPMPPMRPYGPPQRPPMAPMNPYGNPGMNQKPQAAQAPTEAGQAAAAASSTLNIDIQGMAFQPASVTVKAGSTVTWVNRDSAPHTVTSMGSGPLASGTLNRGGSYSMTFDDPGTYTYYCKFHPNMRASIIVE